MQGPRIFTPKEIYRPIGMEADRFRYLVKRGTIKADAQKSEVAGSANKFTAIQGLKAALVNWCDHMGMTLEAGENFVSLVFNQEVFKYLLAGDADYWVVMQGKTAIAVIPNVQMFPGGHRFGIKKGIYNVNEIFIVSLFDGDVVLFVPRKFKEPLVRGCTASFYNVTGLFRFFIDKLGIDTNKDLPMQQ